MGNRSETHIICVSLSQVIRVKIQTRNTHVALRGGEGYSWSNSLDTDELTTREKRWGYHTYMDNKKE